MPLSEKELQVAFKELQRDMNGTVSVLNKEREVKEGLLETLIATRKFIVDAHNRLCDKTAPHYVHPYIPVLQQQIDHIDIMVARAQGKGE